MLKPIEEQLAILKKGTSKTKLIRSARLNDGIHALQNSEEQKYLKEFDDFHGVCTKFTPASGAASRMFKPVYELSSGDSEDADYFFNNISQFPFYNELNEKCLYLFDQGVEVLLNKGELQKVSDAILKKEGLNFGTLPKGLIPFHSYSSGSKSAFQEQLSEAKLLFEGKDKCELHFTIPSDMEEKIADHLNLRNNQHNHIKTSFSVQDPKTNTISLSADNEVLTNAAGELETRPGGHGALIHNLNSIETDLVFIKNIDNVFRQNQLERHLIWKKILGGFLLALQRQLFQFQKQFEENILSHDEVLSFYKRHFFLDLEPESIGQMLFRPIRVCGMIKNEGQPGGGPYFIERNGGVSLQIVESAEIDKGNSEQAEIMSLSTHFNPVDIVCGVKNYKGETYDLTDFVDNEACFVTEKTKGETQLKVLELPGLWNGGMAHWNTVFVEVPSHTFKPVKTVNDLIKKMD